MARIRNIKPDFWTDEKLVDLEPWERLLFIGIWNFVDDEGFMAYSPKRIKMQIFPGDSLEVSRGLQNLILMGALTVYTSDSGDVLQVTNWMRHQKVSNPATSKYRELNLRAVEQKPRNVGKTAADSPEDSRELQRTTELSRKLHKEGEREWEGERVLKDSCSPDGERQRPTRFGEFWQTYPRKVGKQKCIAKYAAAVKRSSEDEVIDGAHRLADDPNLPEAQYIPHPSTWLERNGWEDEPLAPRFTSSSDQRLQQGRDLLSQITEREENPFRKELEP